jgi:hypothetical protein
VSELESERWIGESGLTATNVIGPAHLALGPLVDCAGVGDATHQPHCSLGPNYSLESRRLHNRVRGTSAVPSECERDAHRRPAATSISQHEETGNSRLCNLPISAGFFFCCCLHELAVPGCLLRRIHGIHVPFVSHSPDPAFSRLSTVGFAVSLHPQRRTSPVEVSVGRWLDAALHEASMSPPHARAPRLWKGSSSVSRLSAGAPQVGRVTTLPGTKAYWTARQLLAGRANVLANLDSKLLALAS